MLAGVGCPDKVKPVRSPAGETSGRGSEGRSGRERLIRRRRNAPFALPSMEAVKLAEPGPTSSVRVVSGLASVVLIGRPAYVCSRRWTTSTRPPPTDRRLRLPSAGGQSSGSRSAGVRFGSPRRRPASTVGNQVGFAVLSVWPRLWGSSARRPRGLMSPPPRPPRRRRP